MRKKFKRYAGAGIAAALFLTAVPMQPVSGADLANRESVVESGTCIDAGDMGAMDDYQDESAAFSTEEDISENGQAGADSEDVTAAFTDPNFLAAVREVLGLNENDPVTKSACAAVTELSVNGMNIKTLAGIENFVGLTGLFCRENQLTELDLTKCTQLERLECHDNPIKTLDVSQCPNLRSLNCIGCSQLTELDVTKCPNLTDLWCGRRLTEIDLSQCSKLQTFGCRDGQLTTLDVSGCPDLKELWCDGNQLTELKLGANAALQYLLCEGNQLSKLDAEQCSNLSELYCGENQLEELNISQCNNLKRLDCAGNPLERLECCHNTLSELDIRGCGHLMELDCSGNRLSDLNVSECSGLTDLNCSNNYLKELSLFECVNLKKLDCSYNYMESLDAVSGKNDSLTEENLIYEPQNTDTDITESFTDPNFRAKIRKSLRMGENAPIFKSACVSIFELHLYDWEDIKSLEGIKNLIGLTKLSCTSNQLESLDVSGLKDLKELLCNNGQLIGINAGGCTNLERIICGNNRLSEVNVDGCSRLLELACYSNQLESLDVSSCNALTKLYCGGNQLKSLDVSQCSNLGEIGCNENQLTMLDISKCPNLKGLNCSYNNMKDISALIGDTSNLDFFQFDPQNNSTSEPTPSITPEPSQTPSPEPADTPTQAPKKAQKMTVKPGSLELYMGGDTKSLKVSNAKGSVTYKSINPKIVKVNSKGKVTPVSKGKTYITVKASGDSEYETASKKVNVTVYGKPAKVKGIKAVPAKAKRTLKVSWKKASSVSGYIIKYSYNKNMKNSETIRVNKGSTTSKTLKKLTSKKYVYIQVQAYKRDASTLIKGTWSGKIKSAGKTR